MTGPATTKICVICREDLRGQPRVKDPTGRYFCEPCFERAKEAKRRRKALESVIAANVVPLDARPATPLDGNPAIISVPQTPGAPASRAAASAPSPNSPPISKPRIVGPPTPLRGTIASPPMAPGLAPIEVAASPEYESDDALLAALHERESRWPAPQPHQSSSQLARPEPEFPPTRTNESIPALASNLDDGPDVSAEHVSQSTPESSIEPVPIAEDSEFFVTVDHEIAVPADEPLIPRGDDLVADAAGMSDSDVPSTNPFTEVIAPTPAWTKVQSPLREPSLPLEDSIALEHSDADTCEATPIFAPHLGELPAGLVGHSPRIEQEMLLEDGPPAAAFAGCPHCHRPMPTGAIVCLGCGYNVMTGAVQDEDVHRPFVRHRTSRDGWLGPILLGCVFTTAAAACGRVLYGSEFGFFIFAAASLICLPAWFLWSLLDARNVEGAQLRIWIVPLYVFVYVFRDSRSNYLRAMTVGIVALVIAFAALGYDWSQRERERERASHRLDETHTGE